jgi:hypothetical protein
VNGAHRERGARHVLAADDLTKRIQRCDELTGIRVPSLDRVLECIEKE